MKSFFELFRRPKDRRVDPAEMEGFGTEEPERAETEYSIDSPLLMPDMPDLAQRRTKFGDELEGIDRGVPRDVRLEPGTEIPAERTEQLNREAAAARQARLVKRVAQMKEMALQRALQMSPQVLWDYLDGLKEQAQDSLERAQELREGKQVELAQAEEDEAEVLRAQVEVVRELLQAKRKVQ